MTFLRILYTIEHKGIHWQSRHPWHPRLGSKSSDTNPPSPHHNDPEYTPGAGATHDPARSGMACSTNSSGSQRLTAGEAEHPGYQQRRGQQRSRHLGAHETG